MAQGAPKGPKAKASSGGRKKGGTMPKGKYDIVPKNTQRVKERQVKKNLSSKINSSIEKQMVQAASGGKLTIMKDKGVEAGKGKGKGKDGKK